MSTLVLGCFVLLWLLPLLNGQLVCNFVWFSQALVHFVAACCCSPSFDMLLMLCITYCLLLPAPLIYRNLDLRFVLNTAMLDTQHWPRAPPEALGPWRHAVDDVVRACPSIDLNQWGPDKRGTQQSWRFMVHLIEDKNEKWNFKNMFGNEPLRMPGLANGHVLLALAVLWLAFPMHRSAKPKQKRKKNAQ